MKKKVDLNLLPIAAALLEERNVSRAAEKLGISQPAASRALQRLRKMMGDPLFVKCRAGVEPTPKGLRLATCAGEILSKVQTELFVQQEFNPGTYRGTFSISMTEAAESWLWPEIFPSLRKLSPHSSYRLLRVPASNLARELESGGIDLTVGFFPMLHGNNLIQQGLLRMKSVCLLRTDHPIREKKLTRRQFQKLEHVVVDVTGRTAVMDHTLSTHRLQRKVALVISGYASLASIIANSDLVATVPLALGTRLAESTPNLRTIEPPIDFPALLVAQYWERRFHDDPRNQWLRAMIKEVVASRREVPVHGIMVREAESIVAAS